MVAMLEVVTGDLIGEMITNAVLKRKQDFYIVKFLGDIQHDIHAL